MKKNYKYKNDYLREIINEYPELKSGRKNYLAHNERIEKNFKLIKNFIKKLKMCNN